jgi:hypothetical protein
MSGMVGRKIDRRPERAVHLFQRPDGVVRGALIDSGSVVSGTTHGRRARTSSGNTLYALVAGGRRDSAITFVKTYDGAGAGYYYPVNYEGALNGDSTEIEGRWRIGDGTSGKFLMIRSNGKAVATERKKRAKV